MKLIDKLLLTKTNYCKKYGHDWKRFGFHLIGEYISPMVTACSCCYKVKE